jgi:hypothetical protein
MMKKVGFTLLCASALASTSAFSTAYHQFAQGMAVEYELPANDPQVFSNIFFWKIKATCTIISDDFGSPLAATMLRKSGSVNNTPLLTGDSIGLTVQPGDKINVTVESGAKVELVNRGNYSIKASCIT